MQHTGEDGICVRDRESLDFVVLAISVVEVDDLVGTRVGPCVAAEIQTSVYTGFDSRFTACNTA